MMEADALSQRLGSMSLEASAAPVVPVVTAPQSVSGGGLPATATHVPAPVQEMAFFPTANAGGGGGRAVSTGSGGGGMPLSEFLNTPQVPMSVPSHHSQHHSQHPFPHVLPASTATATAPPTQYVEDEDSSAEQRRLERAAWEENERKAMNAARTAEADHRYVLI